MKLWVVCRLYNQPVDVKAHETKEAAEWHARQLTLHKRDDATIIIRETEAPSLTAFNQALHGWETL